MLIPSAFTVVPHGFELIHIHRTLGVQLIEEASVRFLTVSLTIHIHLQGFVQQIFLRRHDVDDVAERKSTTPAGFMFMWMRQPTM